MLYVDGKRIEKNYPAGTWCECAGCKTLVDYDENNETFIVADYVKLLKKHKPCLRLGESVTNLIKNEYSKIVKKLKSIYKKSYKRTLCFKEFV